MTVFESIPAKLRHIFPGEISVEVLKGYHSASRPYPYAVIIRLWREDSESDRDKKMPGGKWKTSFSGVMPTNIAIDSVSLTGGLTKQFLHEQRPGLRNMLENAVVDEILGIVYDLMAKTRKLARDEPSCPEVRLRFRDQSQFADMMTTLQSLAIPKKADERKLLKRCLHAWTSKKFGPAVHLAYYAEHRPDDLALQPEYDAEVEAFKALAQDSEAALRERLAEMKAARKKAEKAKTKVKAKTQSKKSVLI